MKKLFTILLTAIMVCIFSATAFAAETINLADEAETVKQAEEKKSTVQISAKLTEEDALAAALKDAGKSETDVTVKKNNLSEKEIETGEIIAVYTVRFNDGTTDYKYIVDANNGEILYKGSEYQNPDKVFKERNRVERDTSEKGFRENNSTDDKESITPEPNNTDASEKESRGNKKIDDKESITAELENTDALEKGSRGSNTIDDKESITAVPENTGASEKGSRGTSNTDSKDSNPAEPENTDASADTAA